MIVIHRQRYAKSLFIIFAISGAAASAARTADDEVFVGVANIFVGCVCRRWNGMCLPAINVIHIEWIQNTKVWCRQAQYEFFVATTPPYYTLLSVFLLYTRIYYYFFYCNSFTFIHTRPYLFTLDVIFNRTRAREAEKKNKNVYGNCAKTT